MFSVSLYASFYIFPRSKLHHFYVIISYLYRNYQAVGQIKYAQLISASPHGFKKLSTSLPRNGNQLYRLYVITFHIFSELLKL